MKQIYVGFFSGGRYSRFMEYVHDVLDHPNRKYIEQRLEIIKFYDDYGEDATRRAFGKGRSTVYLWKQKLKRAGGKISSLAPGNRAPKNKRHRIVHPFVERFIIEYRERCDECKLPRVFLYVFRYLLGHRVVVLVGISQPKDITATLRRKRPNRFRIALPVI